MLGFGAASELRSLRSKAKQEGKSLPAPEIPGPKPKRLSGASYSKAVGKWALPFPGEFVRRNSVVIDLSFVGCRHQQDDMVYFLSRLLGIRRIKLI